MDFKYVCMELDESIYGVAEFLIYHILNYTDYIDYILLNEMESYQK